MKKLFNYALLAAALLVGVNVNAQEEVVAKIGEKTYTSLQTAFNEALDGQTIEYAYKETTYDMGEACVELNAAKSITLDLKGNEIKGTGVKSTDPKDQIMFKIHQGTLTVKNGTISQVSESTTGTTSVFYVYGDNKCHFEADGTTPAEYSKLVLAADATLHTTLNGIVIEAFPGSNVACNAVVDVFGRIEDAGKYGIKLNGTVQEPKVGTTLSKTETIIEANLSQYRACLPFIHVEKGAYIQAVPDTKKACGVYCSGYGRYLLEGEITGCTGVYFKGGEVVINGAIISSNANEATNPSFKDGRSGGTGSGIDAGGSAIVIEGSAGSAYSGGTVTITGDAIITAGAGYAIEGVNLNPEAGATTIDAIVVESGTISGANGEGTINFDAEISENVKQEGTITGGTYDDDKIEDIISDVKGVITPVTDEDGNTSYVVTPMDGGKTAAESKDLATAAATDDVMLKADKGLTADAQCKNLVVEKDATLTIEKKLTVYGTLTIQGNVIVESGATLIVEGNGVTCLEASKLVIKSTQAESGMFYLNPEATGNFHPKATVEYYTEAVDGKRDRIGVPAYYGMQFKEIVREYPLSMLIFDNAIGWVPVTSVEQYLAPFQGLTISSTAPSATTLDFPCELVGNANADLKFYPKWNTFSNSYTAKADLTAFIRGQFEAGDAALLEATIHKYDPANPNQVWDPVTLEDLNDPTESKDVVLKPMQAIVIRNKTTQNGNIALSYKDNVWVCRAGAAKAPKIASMEDVNKAVINITSTNGMTDKLTIREASQYTEQFDNGADATKYPNNIFNMYVATEFGDLCQLASNNVEGQVITLATTTETEFTMSFSNIRGEKMAIRDNMTGDVIEMAEGVTYNFIANANEVSERFTIIAAAQAPTALQKAKASAKAAKFIRHDQVVLQNNGRLFNVLGTDVK